MTVVYTGNASAGKGIELRSTTEIACPDDLSDDFQALYAYWDSLRGDAFAPAWRSFDWAGVPTHLIPRCAVVDVQRSPLDFAYRFWGTERTSLQGADYTGKTLRAFQPKAIAEKSFREYCQVIAARGAMLIRTHSPAQAWAPAFDYEFLRLPFSDNGDKVHQILSVGKYDPIAMKLALHVYGALPEAERSFDSLLERLKKLEPEPA